MLVLLDLSYLSRFWTMYEGWLAMQQPTHDGLVLAGAEQASRCTIMPILGASDAYKIALTASIAEKMSSPQLAAAYLANDDVSVTNQSDKQKQLVKLQGLDARVRDAFARDAASTRMELTLQAEPLDAGALKAAISAAEKEGVGDARLEHARRVLKAMAGRSAAPQAEVLRPTNLLLEEELNLQRSVVLACSGRRGVAA